MIPFVVFSLIGHLAECAHKIAIGDFHWYNLMLSPIKAILLFGAVNGNLPLWFLLSLLAVQLLYAYLHRWMRDEWTAVLGFAVAYLTYSLGWHTPLYIGNIALGLLAYSMGHLLKDKQYNVSVFLAFLAVYMVTLVVQPCGIDVHVNEMASGYYPLAVLFGLSGCVVINNLFKKLSVSLHLLEYIGIRSMPFYVMHWIVVRACRWIFDFTGWPLMGVMLGACIIVMPLADKVITALRQEWVFGMNVKLKNK